MGSEMCIRDRASIAKLPEIYKHRALLATFCVIIGLYILGLLWARRKDRKDIAKVCLQSLKLILLNGTLGIQLDLHPDSRLQNSLKPFALLLDTTNCLSPLEFVK